VPVALAFAVLDVDPSPSALGFVLVARSIPLVGFLPSGASGPTGWNVSA